MLLPTVCIHMETKLYTIVNFTFTLSYSCIAHKRTLRDKINVYSYHKISSGFHKKMMKQSYLEEPGLQTVDVVDPIHQHDNLLRGDLKYSRWQLTDCLAVWQQLAWFNDTLNSSIIFCGQFIVFTHHCAKSNFCVLSLASDNNFHQTKLLFRMSNSDIFYIFHQIK